MKKIILMPAIVLLATTTTQAQTKVPEAVSSSFAKKFPTATAVKWDKENAHEYEVGFTVKGEKHSANFSDKGEWLETESTITFATLPEAVKDAYNKVHKPIAVIATAKIETAKGERKYEVEFKKGKKTIEKTF